MVEEREAKNKPGGYRGHRREGAGSGGREFALRLEGRVGLDLQGLVSLGFGFYPKINEPEGVLGKGKAWLGRRGTRGIEKWVGRGASGFSRAQVVRVAQTKVRKVGWREAQTF